MKRISLLTSCRGDGCRGGVCAEQAHRHHQHGGSRVDRARGRRRSDHRSKRWREAIRIRISSRRSRASSSSSEADLLVAVGRELEIGWLPPLIQQSRNAKIQAGRAGLSGRVAAARRFSRFRPATSRARWATSTRWATRTTGWIPRTASASRSEIADKLSELRPADRAYFQQRLADFTTPSGRRRKALAGADGALQGTRRVVTYHRSFPNFAERFGLDIVGYVEPRPGIPPTPQHTLDLINEMKRQNVKLVLGRAVFRSEDAQRHRAGDRRAGARSCRRRSAARRR